MAEKLGIEDVLPFVEASMKLANIVGLAMLDGMVNVADFPLLMKLPGVMVDLGRVDFTKLWPEFKDMDGTERKQILDGLKVSLDLPEKHLEAMIEGYLTQAQGFFDWLSKAVSFHKQVQGDIAA